jgi:exosortase
MALWIALGTLTTLLGWSYWSALVVLTVAWQSPAYQYAWLILLFAGVVLWARCRRRSMGPVPGGVRWLGVLFLALSLACRLVAAHCGWHTAELATAVPALASLWLLAFGWPGLAAGGPAAALLLFMLPPGSGTESAILDRAQALATRGATFALQTLGVEAYREGNVIHVGETQSGVVGHSSRLRLAAVVSALAAAVALAARRAMWERLLILLSGPVIVVAVNACCLTGAGLLRYWGRPGVADRAWGTAGSVAMLSAAALLVLLESVVLSHVYREVRPEAAARPEAEAAP